MTVQEIRRTLTPVFEKYRDRIVFAYVFGSMSRNTGSPLSDIDLAVFLTKASKKEHLELKIMLYTDFLRALKTNAIDVVILNITTNIILLDEITRNGVLLFDQDADVRIKFEQDVLHRYIDFKSHRKVLMGI